MSHERTVTVGVDGKFFNVPTVVGGKPVTTKTAVDYAFKMKKAGKAFATKDAAVAAARKRSAAILPHKRK